MEHSIWYKKLYSLFMMALVCLSLQATGQPIALKSPDGKLELNIFTEGQLAYSLKHNNQLLLDKIPFTNANRNARISFAAYPIKESKRRASCKGKWANLS